MRGLPFSPNPVSRRLEFAACVWLRIGLSSFWQVIGASDDTAAHDHGAHKASMTVLPGGKVLQAVQASDCVWDDWSVFGECSHSCGGGSRARFRGRKGPEGGGAECVGMNQEEVSCQTQECPIDCKVDDWTEWLDCSVTCGGPGKGGKRVRTRPRKHEASHGGKDCTQSLSEVGVCMNQKSEGCPAECRWGQWSTFSKCSLTCGTYGGLTLRSRSIQEQARFGGPLCKGSSYESRVCGKVDCIIDCAWYEWQDWTSCSLTCGPGTKLRARDLKTEQNGYGMCPGSGIDTGSCNAGPCPVDCSFNEWGEWDSCTAECGGGEKEKRRSMNPAKGGGKKCVQETKWSMPCNMDQCTT
jgi:hemicentin